MMFGSNFQIISNSTASTEPFLYLLPAADQHAYIYLSNFFAVAEDRNKRNLGLPTFIKHLTMIHEFINQKDMYDGVRGMLCGIHFGQNSFLVNTSKLKKFMNRSKSCINGCFQKIGYNMVRPSKEMPALLTEITTIGATIHTMSSRQWCVRQAEGKPPVSFEPTTKVRLAQNKETKKKPMFYVDLESLLNKKSPLPLNNMYGIPLRTTVG